MLGSFRRALAYVPRYRRSLALGTLCQVPNTLIDLGIPLVWRSAINGALDRTLEPLALAGLALFALALALVAAALKYGVRWQMIGASRYFERDLRHDVFKKLLELPPSYFGKASVGDLVSRMTQDVEAVRMALGPGWMYLSNTLLIVPLTLGLMCSLDLTLTLWMALPVVLLGAIVAWLAPQLEKASAAVQQGIARISSLAAESFSGIRVLKIFTREDAQLRRMEKSGLDYLAANMRLARARGGMMALVLLVRDLGFALILLIGSLHVIGGRATVGDFFVFRDWLVLCFWPLVTFGWMVSMVQRGSAGMTRVVELLDARVDITSPAQPKRALGPYDLVWDRVSLELAGRRVLDDVTITVPAGTSLGITGRTGSGKSLLVQLVSRLLDVTLGSVRVGGVDGREWDLDALRRTVSFVPQESFLFSDSLRENLRFARPDADDAALLQAAGKAGLALDLAGFPQGLDTRVGERGVTLSGGQRQRTALARALLVAAPVVVLDDSLSAVDAETEAAILAALRDELAGRTAVIVSHRIAALRTLDRVAVLDHGRLVEFGTHAELVRRGGLYSRLDHDQRLLQELEAL